MRLQTLKIALVTLLEARDDSDIDETTPTVFLAPDGTEYRLGMFELSQRDTDDERLVVDLIPVDDPPTEHLSAIEWFRYRIEALLAGHDGWSEIVTTATHEEANTMADSLRRRGLTVRIVRITHARIEEKVGG